MKKRRSKMEIHVEVLKEIKEGATKPTRLMHRGNLSWASLQTALKRLHAQGFIDEIDVSRSSDKRSSKEYQITGKGNNVLQYYNIVRDLIKVDDPSINISPITRKVE